MVYLCGPEGNEQYDPLDNNNNYISLEQQRHQPSNTTSSNMSSSLDPSRFEREHSHFGDAHSVKSRNSYGTFPPRYHDEPEADYDTGATELYRHIENKDWDGALSRLEVEPVEAKTWVSRREYDGAKIRWRLLPIHAVCIFRAPLALIEALVEVYPDGPQMKDDQGMLPLHLACRNGASKGVVMTLLAAFPDALRVFDRKNRTPIDLVENSNSANKEAVLIAIRRFQKEYETSMKTNPSPSAAAAALSSVNTTASGAGYSTTRSESQPSSGRKVNEVDYENRTVLFRLILKKDWKSVNTRASTYPDEAATWIVTKGFHGNLRFLPLHKACVLQPHEDTISALLKAYPEGANSKDQDGWLPLHCACFYAANDKIVNELLQAEPKGAQSKDDEGRLPLHYACLKGASKAVVDILLASFAKGAMVKDDEGRLPIHHACSKSAPEDIIEALLKASPKGAQSKDDQGRLALHHACRKNASERVIRTLLRVYPRAAQIKDDQDKLPIHYACQHAADKSVLSLLLQTYPESVNVQNGFGLTPLAELKALNHPKMDSCIKLLEKTKKEQDKQRVASGETTETDVKISLLEEQIKHLEKTLGKVSILGKEMKNDLKRKKDPAVIIDKFATALIELGNRSKTPLRSRQTITPGKVGGLFGRARTAKAAVGK